MSLICQMGSCTRRRCSPLCTWDTRAVEESLPAALCCRSLRLSSLILHMKVQPLRKDLFWLLLLTVFLREPVFIKHLKYLSNYAIFYSGFYCSTQFCNLSLFCHHNLAYWILFFWNLKCLIASGKGCIIEIDLTGTLNKIHVLKRHFLHWPCLQKICFSCLTTIKCTIAPMSSFNSALPHCVIHHRHRSINTALRLQWPSVLKCYNL